MNYQQLKKKVLELCAAADKKCPVIVGELENVDGPLNMNPAAATPITWGGWQSQDEDVVKTNGKQLEIVADVCAVHVTMSITVVNEGGGATGNAQRAHPEVWILRNGVRWALGQTYIRDANGQDSDTASVDKWDLQPRVGTVYSLEIQQDSIDNPATGQAGAALEAFRDPEIASYLQAAAFLA